MGNGLGHLKKLSKGDKWLRGLYKDYNRILWGGKLPEIPVYFARTGGVRGTAAMTWINYDGTDRPEKPLKIVIHKRLFKAQLYAYIQMMLLHEMCHVATFTEKRDHGPRYCKELRRIVKSKIFWRLVGMPGDPLE